MRKRVLLIPIDFGAWVSRVAARIPVLSDWIMGHRHLYTRGGSCHSEYPYF